MKSILFFAGMAALGLVAVAQPNTTAARLADPDNFDPTKPTKILVDLKQCTYAGVAEHLIGSTEDLYMWTWSPAEAGRACLNGSWDKSSDCLRMTPEGNDVWSFTLTPTEFYGVDIATIYDKDFSLLVKKKDASKPAGATDEPKTEDCKIEVAPPNFKVYSLPPPKSANNDSTFSSANEVFSLFYDNNLETKPTLAGQTEFYVYCRGTLDNGSNVILKGFTQLTGDPTYQMTSLGAGLYRYQFIPNQLYAPKIPTGQRLVRITLQIVKANAANSNDAVAPYSATLSDCQ